MKRHTLEVMISFLRLQEQIIFIMSDVCEMLGALLTVRVSLQNRLQPRTDMSMPKVFFVYKQPVEVVFFAKWS